MRGTVLFALLAAGIATAGNMWENHGINFSYLRHGTVDSITVFPVIWDIRGAGVQYRYYCDVYCIDPSTDPVLDLLEEAQRSGVNTAMVRTELQQEAVPGSYSLTDYDFEEVADEVREMGLNVIVGGFLTDTGEDEHNDATLEYLKDYVNFTAGLYPGEVIGVFGFDEPAVKFLENPETCWEWVEMVAYYRDQCNSQIGLPMLSFISKYGTIDSAGTMHFYDDTTSVLNRFARHLDVISLNMYPVKNNDRRLAHISFESGDMLFCGTTDLIPSPSPYYEVYCDRDEFFAVTAEGDSSRFTVYEFLSTPGFDDIYLQEAYTHPLSFRPTDMASSDFRACDTGDRRYTEHRLNGAVILWDSTGKAGEEVVFIHDGQGIVSMRMPGFPGSDSSFPVAFCVGQAGYRSTDDPSQGILGRWDTAILGCYTQGGPDLLLAVFARERDGGLALQTREPYTVQQLSRVGIVWGRFWGDGLPEPPLFQPEDGGFVVYDERGNYLYLLPDRGRWQIYPCFQPVFKGLFGPYHEPAEVFVSHECGTEPPYTPGNDFIAAFFPHPAPVLTRTRSRGMAARLDSLMTSSLHGIGDILSVCTYRPDKSYGDVLLATDGNRLYRSSGTIGGAEPGGTVQMQQLSSSSGDIILPGARVMHTRENIRAGVVLSQHALLLPSAELQWTDYDHLRLRWFTECFEVVMENGVRTTELDNCAFANIQAYGRHAFGLPSYCASRDTLLWMVTVPVIKGCRGLVLYSMDISLMCGNRTEDQTLRYPDLLQNWGPSRDVGNIDMPGRLHSVIASLTGNSPAEGPDFLSATVDPGFRVLQTSEAVNCDFNTMTGTTPGPSDTTLNFLALEEMQSGDILLMVANESGAQIGPGRGIGFPGRFGGNYTLEVIDGFQPFIRNACLEDDNSLYGAISTGTLMLDFSGMPSTTASLLRLTSGSPEPEDSAFLQVFNFGGSSWVRFRAAVGAMGELAVYDLAGRKISVMWYGQGGADVIEMTVDGSGLPPGVYFVTLASGGQFISRKAVLL
ncbi:MAG: hypothetical protein AVO35_05830 [Candidatus Aegiribacteria sp. MLS_C]|nr:MAG: hypothetical protein AVO35_05830 [Candidatus Aegiribacteria sp. MLS_C]